MSDRSLHLIIFGTVQCLQNDTTSPLSPEKFKGLSSSLLVEDELSSNVELWPSVQNQLLQVVWEGDDLV